MRLPAPLRAAVGLVAIAADELAAGARRLPDRALELPMLAVSTALQASLRAQQRYAQLAARGDEVLGQTRTSDDPPAWATFDEPVSAEELYRTTQEQEHEAGVARAPRKAPAKKAAAAKKTAKKAATAKKISAPRNQTPSAFDRAPDEPS